MKTTEAGILNLGFFWKGVVMNMFFGVAAGQTGPSFVNSSKMMAKRYAEKTRKKLIVSAS
jgi:hypothetical protein